MPALMTREQVALRPSRTTRGSLVLVADVASEPPRSDVGDFGAIAELHRDHLRRVAVRLSGNAEVAKDLVQETLLRALRRFDRFQPGTHVRTWLVTILTNVFLDQVKHENVKRKAEPELVALEPLEGNPALSVVPDAELYAAIQALEPELRDVVDLCYLKQLRYREVSAKLNLPIGTIGTRLMRARARLRELLSTSSREP
jgi:RNA polymerase sigma-70 factor (ECF subfamily)